MSISTESELKRDVVGLFFDEPNLSAVIKRLREAGIEDTQIGLLCSESTLKEKLGGLYERINSKSDDTDSPNMGLVEADAIGSTPYAALGALSFVGGAVGGGALVTTVGVLGGALAVATAGSVVVGGLGALALGLMGKSDAEALQEQLDAGHILLFVRVNEDRIKDQIIEIIHNESGIAPRQLKPELVTH